MAAPLATCSLLVERRGDCLVLEFAKDDGSLFAQSVVDCSVAHGDAPQQPRRLVQHWLESTVDSSRYFTLKIADGGTGRAAVIGFGFRERDAATDLREAMQHYESALRREQQPAAALGAKTEHYCVPKLAAGETIHVNTGKAASAATARPKKETTAHKTGLPLLLKKPPPSPESAKRKLKLAAYDSKNLGDAIEATRLQGTTPAGDGPIAAIDADDDWDAEFVSAN